MMLEWFFISAEKS